MAEQLMSSIKSKPEPGQFTYVYFFEDGGVVHMISREPDTNLLAHCYMAMASHPAQGNSAPFVEIIKSRFGPASVIMTADYPAADASTNEE